MKGNDSGSLEERSATDARIEIPVPAPNASIASSYAARRSSPMGAAPGLKIAAVLHRERHRSRGDVRLVRVEASRRNRGFG
jgi:hypothetical protein